MSNSKRLLVCALSVGFLTFAALGVLAHGNDRGEAKVTIGKAKVSVEYGRPMLKGRDLAKMLPPGQVWRIGADAATTLETDTDLDFGGTRVPKGKHILLARLVEAGKWTLIFSTKGVFQYEPSAKIAEVPLELAQGNESVEELAIQLSNKGGRGVLEITWGTQRLTASFAPSK